VTTGLRPILLPAVLTAETREEVRQSLLHAVAEARANRIPRLLLNGRDVASLDAVGLGVLVLVEKRAADVGVQVQLVQPSPVLAQLLRASGLASVFGIPTTP
jgi:anti-anti-sigma factor